MEGIDRAHLFAFHFPSFLPDFPKSACEAKIEVRKKNPIGKLALKKYLSWPLLSSRGKTRDLRNKKKKHQEDLKATKGWAFYSASIIMDLVGEQKICGQNLDSF